MRKLCWTALFVIAATGSLSPSGWAGKTIVDPNSRSSEVAMPAEEKADPRMSQKTTYDSGYKRLNAVIEDIRRISGVDIRCGNNSIDWRVRDIPVVVCVKDMPLGKLLRAIADATHTWVASEKIGDDPKKSYRIYRRQKERDKIDAFFKSRREARLEAALWQWDAMAAYGKSKEIPELAEREVFWKMWPIAKLIATLGPDSKDRLVRGNAFQFSGKDPACREVIAGLCEQSWALKSRFRSPGESPNEASTLTSEAIEASTLSIKLVDEGESGDTKVEWTFGPMAVPGEAPSHWSYTIGNARNLRDKGLGLPPYPEEVETPAVKDDMPNTEMTFLCRGKDADWDRPLLSGKINVVKPEGLKDATFADAIRAIAAASGLNIVAEDFVSHMLGQYQVVDPVFKKDTSVRDSLNGMYFGGDCLSYQWFFNESDKQLVGWPGDTVGNNVWRELHRNMLSEEYLTGLKRKLDGDGVEFDDIIHFANIPSGTDFSNSFGKWIYLSRDLQDLTPARVSGDTVVLWQLYDSLQPEDKATAKTAGGLPLAKFDATWIADFFRKQKLAEKAPFTGDGNTEEEDATASEERKLRDKVLSDPRVISSMVMRVEKSPARPDRTICHGTIKRSNHPALKLSEHTMVVSYKMDGEDHKMTIEGPDMATPIKSAAREAEIIKAASKDKPGG